MGALMNTAIRAACRLGLAAAFAAGLAAWLYGSSDLVHELARHHARSLFGAPAERRDFVELHHAVVQLAAAHWQWREIGLPGEQSVYVRGTATDVATRALAAGMPSLAKKAAEIARSVAR